MSRRLKQSQCLIGLDIGMSSIKAVQVTQQSRGPRLAGTLCLARRQQGGALSEDESWRLQRVMQRRGLDAVQVALLASSEALISTNIAVPPADRELDRDPIVKMELSRAHRLLPDRFEYAWWDLPISASGGQTNQAQAVALPHAAVSATLEALDGIGLEVVRTVPVSLALLAAAQRRPIDPRRIVAVLDLGAKAAHLVLMHAGRVVHTRNLPEFNSSAIHAAVQQQLGVGARLATEALGHYGLSDQPEGRVASETTAALSSAASDLAEQVGMSFAYISHLYPQADLGPLLLVGGAARVPGLDQALSRELELEASVLTPAELCDNPFGLAEADDPTLVSALGAALTTGGEQ